NYNSTTAWSSALMSTTLRSPNRQLTCATSPSSQRSTYIGCTACDISTPPPPRGVASQVWTVGGASKPVVWARKISPMPSCCTISPIFSTAGLYTRLCTGRSLRPALLAAASIRSHSASVGASGFSHTTCLPASSASTEYCSCRSCGSNTPTHWTWSSDSTSSQLAYTWPIPSVSARSRASA